MGKNSKNDGLEPGPTRPESLRSPAADDLARNLWERAPGLSWIMDLEDGQLQVHGTSPGATVATVPITAFGRVLRAKVREQGAETMQFLAEFPAPDGTNHHFLVIGFPLGGNGARQRQLAGVALDVTQHKQRVDQLARQALIDELTCVYNLRGFQLFAEHELKVARRRGTLSAVIYVDVDGLKKTNDTSGHAEGDAVLIATTTLLRKVYRECDVIGRLGGDEFAVFASDVRGDPDRLAERLRVEAQGAVSIGVACCAPSENLPLAGLVAAADHAMYRDKAKKAGRVSLATAAAAFAGTFHPDTGS